MCFSRMFAMVWDRQFFLLNGYKGNNVLTKCVMCGPTVKIISTAKNITANLRRYITVSQLLIYLFHIMICTNIANKLV